MTKRRNLRSRSNKLASRNLHHETLEKRELLASDLVSVSATVTEQFDLGLVTELNESPSELTFRFGGTTAVDPAALASFTFTASGGDGTFDDGNETLVEPGFLGFGDSDRIVVARMAGDLADDTYRISVPQTTETTPGVIDAAFDFAEVDFRLELGPRVVAVVPQPITGPSSNRVQATNQIDVFFNEDPLSRVSAGTISYSITDAGSPVLPVVDPANYRLFETSGTVETTDDLADEVPVIAVSYDPALNKATLTLATDLQSTGAKDAYRLRIGSGQDLAAAPTQVTVSETANPGDTFASALASSVNIQFDPDQGLQSQVLVGGEIRNDSSYVLPWPGAYETPGIRDDGGDPILTRDTDSTIGINVFSYNFADLYGRNASGQLLDNAITPAQQDRIREVLDLFEESLGVRFVETADSGLQFVTGELGAVLQTADTGPGDGTPKSLFRINEQDPSKGVLVLDASENFFDGYGLSPDARPSYFVEAIQGIGNILGIGGLYELPTGIDGATGSQDEPNSELFSNDGDGNGLNVAGFPVTTAEPDFLSQAAKVIGQAVNRPESDDVDLYAFTIDNNATGDASGIVTIETYAQRLDEASLLDSVIRLYRVGGPAGNQTFELVSRNDDSFGDDSQLSVELTPGRYIVGVSSTGNEDYYGEKADDSATGGRTEGRYDLRITFDSQTQNGSTSPQGLTDAEGSALDGDADGIAGGDFNFWFRAASQSATSPRTIFVDPDASSGNGNLATPFNRISDALAAADSGDIVRLLPSDGADNDLSTTDDNLSYNIGRGGPGNTILRDGETFQVPAGVTVMIDAGSILKFGDAKIVAGSESVDDDRSLAAVQVLGTPENSVILTSFLDESVGLDANTAITTTPQPADWGGIEFRDDIDLVEGRDVFQSEGIFVNFVSHADIRYGGGTVRSTESPTSPITIADARPTIIYNSITDSSGAAITATPNSFREDTFNSPQYQRFSNDPDNGIFYSFTSDYSRVGPEIVGNDLLRNTTNGLSISIQTPTGGVTESMTVSGRFDDTDITHVITDSLTVAGNPGGALLVEDRPDVASVTGTSLSGGSLTATSYRYVVTFVTVEGQESLPSVPTRSFNSGGTIELRNLPAAPDGFVGRRIYRADATATVQEFTLVDQIDRSSVRFTDTGNNDRGGTLLSVVVPSVSGVTLTRSTPTAPVFDDAGFPVSGTLVAGQGYDYRFTFTDEFGAESVASVATSTIFATQDGVIRIDGIPQPPLRDSSAGIFTGTNVYRSNPVSGQFERIAEIRLGETSLIDDGTPSDLATTVLGSTLGLDAFRSSKLLPRFDARLTVDPGTVVKLDTTRIEVNFGADFYAEGTQDAPIIFTSISDNEFGGSTFETTGNPLSVGAAGDWGGFSIRQSSTASFDYATVRFGGGAAVLEGSLRDTNALEILQADVRVTNSRFLDNADGFSQVLAPNDIRLGRGFNAPATIFIRGSQPIIVDNVIDNGEGAAISINPDSFSPDANIDHGRSTGNVDLNTTKLNNQGPLIAGNEIANHGLNGLDVRGEIVTIDSVWDDTDITHIVQDPIFSLTNAYGGALRLRSDSNAALVVKFGPNGTLEADGRPLDIEDRIGGTLQILGTSSFPVVLTSLNDDTVGGGFTPDGLPGVDTVGPEVLDAFGSPVAPAPGDWVGLTIGTYSNDRNVAFRYETELPNAADSATNDSPDTSESLGTLASRENASDENDRLGFQVRGLLSSPTDVDVYSFSGFGGTEVVLDIDETSTGLDTVVELITIDGRLIASSDNSRDESVGISSIFVDESLSGGVLNENVRPLETTITSTNVESTNASDAGFKIQLPGDASTQREYFIRVRNAEEITTGQYTLAVRLGDGNETAGSNIRRADIRYASTAINVVAAPIHSPLAGEVGEEVTFIDPTPDDLNSGDEAIREVVDLRLNQNFGGAAQSIGNLLTSDRGSLVVTGEIGNLNNSLSDPTQYNSLLNERLEDVDIYRVDLFSQQISPDDFDSENRFVTTVFDIDYADQLGRPDTRLSVFNSAGQLILVGSDSNIADDNARPVEGVDSSNLSAGSSGTLDAFIGPVTLPEGTYFVAVSNAAVVPSSLDQFFDASPTNTTTRLVPINSTRRISSDNFSEFDDGTGVGFGFQLDDYTAENAYIIPNFDEGSVVPYTLDDISLFVSYEGSIDGNDAKTLASFNPFTGVMTRVIGDSQSPIGDLAIRQDGNLVAYTLGPNGGGQNNGNTGNFQRLSAADGSILNSNDDGIEFRQNTQNGNNNQVDGDAQLIINATAFTPFAGDSPTPANGIAAGARSFVIGTRDSFGRGSEETVNGPTGIPLSVRTNIVYLASASTGEIGSGIGGSLNNNADRNFGNDPYDITQGPAGDEIEVGVVDTGQIDIASGKDAGTITGLSFRTDVDGFQTGELVAVTDNGGIHVFDPNVSGPAPIGSDAEGYQRVISTSFLGTDLPVNPEHTDFFGTPVTSLQFSGLAYAPQTIEGGTYLDTYVATTSDGWLYAFKLETIEDQLTAVPANIFYNGRASVELSFGSFGNSFPDFSVGRTATGLAFSTLQVAPISSVIDRSGDAGHGLVQTEENSRLNTSGGNSLYFGFDLNNNTLSTGDGAGGSVLSPGGLQAEAVSDSIDLSDYSAGDKPTLYFTYFIDVEDSANNLSPAVERDTFRVFGSGADGQYRLLATNDDFRNLGVTDSFDEFNRVLTRDLDTTPGFEEAIPVQEIFGGGWRQARVDLSPFAGDSDVKLRFDFSTAGSHLEQFGSVELVARDGEVIPDNDLVLLLDDDFQGAVLQTIVGRDIIFNDGSNYNDGDSLTITAADGTVTTVVFVAAETTPIAGTVQILIDPTATALEVATLVGGSLPRSLSERVDGDGRLSLLRAVDVTVDSAIDAGQSNPVPYSNDGLQVLVTPNAIEAVDGEQVIVTVDGFAPQTFTYRRLGNESIDPDVRRFEIVFDDTFPDVDLGQLAVAQEASQIINAAFVAEFGSGQVSFVIDSDVRFVSTNVTLDLIAGPSQLAVRGVGDPRVFAQFTSGILTNDDETIRLVDSAGDVFRIVLNDDADVPANLVQAGETLIDVTFDNSFTATQIRDAVIDAVNLAAPTLDAQPENSGAGVDNAATFDSSDVNGTQRQNAVTSANELGVRIDFPTAANLVDGEVLTITPAGGSPVAVTFNDAAGASSPGNVVYQSQGVATDTSIATLISDFINVALEGNFEIGTFGSGILIYGVESAEVTFSNDATNFQTSVVSGQRLTIPSGADLNDRDSIQATVNEQTDDTNDIANTTLFTFIDEGFNDPADETGEIGFLSTDTATEIRDRLAPFYSYSFSTTSPGGQIQLLIPANGFNEFVPDRSVDPLRFENFVEVDLPAGNDIRTGETISFFLPGGDAITVVFVRVGAAFTVPDGQVPLYFTEASTQNELGLQAANRINLIDVNFVTVSTPTGFGIAVPGAAAFLGIDPIASKRDVTDPETSFAIPITVASGDLISEGETLTIFRRNRPFEQTGQVFEFTNDPFDPTDPNDPFVVAGVTPVPFAAGETAAEIGARLLTLLDGDLRAEFSTDFVNEDRTLLLANASSVVVGAGDDGMSSLISFQASENTTLQFGRTVRATPILINESTVANDVSASLQVALADALGSLAADPLNVSIDGAATTTASTLQYKVEAGNRVRIFNTTISDAGNYGLNSFLPADVFGAPLPTFIGNATRTFGQVAGQNNQVEGVYIDDVIIGFAERGEMVLNGASNANFVLDPAYTPDSRSSNLDRPANNTDQPEFPDQILVGQYSLEVRTGDSYGVPQNYDPINLILDESFSSAGRTFDTNDRLSDGAVTIIFPSGLEILDGDRFVLADGLRTVTFEYNNILIDSPGDERVDSGNIAIDFNPADADFEIAQSTRDAINTEQFVGNTAGGSDLSGLRILALSGDGAEVGATASSRVELFGDEISVNPTFHNLGTDQFGDLGRFIRIDAVETETPFGVATNVRFPVVDQDTRQVAYLNLGDQLAQAAVTDYVPGDTLFVDGKIGDRIAQGIQNNVSADDGAILSSDPTEDIDIFRIYLTAGSSIDIDVDTTGLLRDTSRLVAPVITVFETGAVFADTPNFLDSVVGFTGFNTPEPGFGETESGAQLTFTANADAYYDVAISSRFAYEGGTFALNPDFDPFGPFTPDNQFFDPADAGFGDYQLTIRPSLDTAATLAATEDTGLSQVGVPLRDFLFVDYQFGKSDSNRVDDQGQVLIEGNIIRDSLNFAIDASIGARGQTLTSTGLDELTTPGSARLLRNQNTSALVPGTVIVNNLIIDSVALPGEADDATATAIRFAGGTFGNGEAPSPNVFGRIINNTIIGDGDGIAIDIDGRSAPSIINNVVVNADAGVNVNTVTANQTVAASNVFANVTTPSNIDQGTTTIILDSVDGLFSNNTNNGEPVFVPAANSVLVDSSLETLRGRLDFEESVKGTVNIAPSPVVAPQVDALGNQRVDSPGVGSGGTGGNVAVDRGALEQVDLSPPTARLTSPLDAVDRIVPGGDTATTASFVRLATAQSLPFFEIELTDIGIGLDLGTVSPLAVTLIQNEDPLVLGEDYTFAFSPSGTTIRLTSTRGNFRGDATYEIVLSQSIRDLAGNSLAATAADGRTVLTIITSDVVVDLGDAPDSYQTLSTSGGPVHSSPEAGSVILGSLVDTEPEAVDTASGATSDDLGDGADADDQIATVAVDLSESPTLTLVTSANQTELTVSSVPNPGDVTRISLGGRTFIAEFSSSTFNTAIGRTTIEVDAASTVQSVAADLTAELELFLAGNTDGISIAQSASDDTITFQAIDDEDGVSVGVTTQAGRDYFVFGTPEANGTVLDSNVEGILVSGESTTISVSVTGDGFLDAWIDFNGNGSFDAQDRIATALPVTTGINLLTINTPGGITAPIDTYARFRVSSVGNLGPAGVISGGEVEDYRVSIAAENSDFGLPINTQPTFDVDAVTIVTESGDANARTVENFLTNLLPGSPNKPTENQQQSVTSVTVSNVTSTSGLLIADSISIVTPGTGGDTTGDLVFATNPDLFGEITFDIVATDSEGLSSDTVSLTLRVAPTNNPPVVGIVDGTIIVAENSAPFSELQVDPRSTGPIDEQDQTLTITTTVAPEFQSLFDVLPAIDENGILTFTVASGSNTVPTGPIPVTVTAQDNGGSAGGGNDTTVLSFSIEITEVDSVPVGVTDEFNTDEDSILRFTVADLLDNDLDPDLVTNPNESLTLILDPVTSSANGAVITFDSDTGEISYDPTSRILSPDLQALSNDGVTIDTLVDTFTYLVQDSTGRFSGSVSVEVTVSGENDAPILLPDTPTLSSSGSTIITPLDNDFDIDGTIDASSIAFPLQPAFGTVTSSADGTIVYTPFDSFGEDDVFTYTVADNLGSRSEPQLITISANASPIAGNDSFTVLTDQTTSINLAANDSDPNGSVNLSSIVIVRTPLRGNVVVQTNGTVDYTPSNGFTGLDTFTYQIADNAGRLSNVATARVQVVASNLQNPNMFNDVNADGFVTAIDALLIVNFVGRSGGGSIEVLPSDVGPNFFDANGSRTITTLDALAVIQELERINNRTFFEQEQVFANVSDFSSQSRFASASTPAEFSEVSDDAINAKLLDVSSPTSQFEDVIDSIASDSTSGRQRLRTLGNR